MKEKVQLYKNVKEKRAKVRELLNLPMELQNIDVGVEFIQALIPVNLLYVHSAFEDEVKQLAGEQIVTQIATGGEDREVSISWGAKSPSRCVKNKR